MQPAEKNEDSATQSGRRGDNDDEVISTTSSVSAGHPVDGQETVSTNNKIEKIRPEPSKDSEIETSKESDTAKVADVKIVCDINESARSLNTPLTKMQEELGAENTNELDEDSDCETRESSSNHEEQLHKEAKRDCKATLNSQLKDRSEDGGKEKIEKAVLDTLGLV